MERSFFILTPLLAALLIALLRPSDRRMMKSVILAQTLIPAGLFLRSEGAWAADAGVRLFGGTLLVLLCAISLAFVLRAPHGREDAGSADKTTYLLFGGSHFFLALTLLSPNVLVAIGAFVGAALLVAFVTLSELVREERGEWPRGMLVGALLSLFGVFLLAAASGATKPGELTYSGLAGQIVEGGSALMNAALAIIFVGVLLILARFPYRMSAGNHSQVWTVLSGALMVAALFLLLRFRGVAVSVGETAIPDLLFLITGFGILAVGAFAVHAAENLFALVRALFLGLAGIALLGIGWGVAAAVELFLFGAVAAGMCVLAAGHLDAIYSGVTPMRGATRVAPWPGTALFVGVLALLALPPVPIFFRYFELLSTAFATHPGAVIALLVLFLILFTGALRAFLPLLFGPAPPGLTPPETLSLRHLPFLILLVVLLAAELIPAVADRLDQGALQIIESRNL